MQGMQPPSRWGQAMCPTSTSKLFVFGGVNMNIYLDACFSTLEFKKNETKKKLRIKNKRD